MPDVLIKVDLTRSPQEQPVPHACCTLAIPTEIFEFDITPSTSGPVSISRGQEASTS